MAISRWFTSTGSISETKSENPLFCHLTSLIFTLFHHRVVTGFLTSVTISADVLMLLIPMLILIFMLMLTRAVESDFKKSNKKSDA